MGIVKDVTDVQRKEHLRVHQNSFHHTSCLSHSSHQKKLRSADHSSSSEI